MTTSVANFKIAKGKTKNYMDYITERNYFHKYQAEIIKKECISLYN